MSHIVNYVFSQMNRSRSVPISDVLGLLDDSDEEVQEPIIFRNYSFYMSGNDTTINKIRFLFTLRFFF